MGEAASTKDLPSGAVKRTRTRRTDTQDPRRARERALKILFQADVRGVAPETTLRRLANDPAARAMLDEVEDLTNEGGILPEPADRSGGTADRSGGGAAAGGRAAGSRAGASRTPGIDGFTRSLVLGVADNQPRIDGLIGRFARRWQIHRMPVLDRNVLRLGTYELLFEQTSPAVVINEAVNLAKALSTDDSGRYVNGVLEAIRRHLAEAAATADGAHQDGGPEGGAAREEEPGDHQSGAAASDDGVGEPHAPGEAGTA
jgi:transcription antitermination protein NusB